MVDPTCLSFLTATHRPFQNPPQNTTHHNRATTPPWRTAPTATRSTSCASLRRMPRGKYVRTNVRTRGSSIIYHPPNPTPFTNINMDRSPHNKIYRPTYGRYLQSKLIRPEMEFCMQTDAHMDVSRTFLCLCGWCSYVLLAWCTEHSLLTTYIHTNAVSLRLGRHPPRHVG